MSRLPASTRTGTSRSVGRLHVLTPTEGAEALVRAALAGGAPTIQVRDKSGDDRRLLDRARTLTRAAHDAGAQCIVNDRVDVALAAGADGVHLGAEDLPVAAARRIGGDHLIIGATARDAEAARVAEGEGATYVGVGPVHRSTTKTGLPAPGGPALIERVADAVTIPVIAISGIGLDDVGPLREAGAHGVAVIGAVAGSPDPRAATAAFVRALGGGGR